MASSQRGQKTLVGGTTTATTTTEKKSLPYRQNSTKCPRKRQKKTHVCWNHTMKHTIREGGGVGGSSKKEGIHNVYIGAVAVVMRVPNRKKNKKWKTIRTKRAKKSEMNEGWKINKKGKKIKKKGRTKNRQASVGATINGATTVVLTQKSQQKAGNKYNPDYRYTVAQYDMFAFSYTSPGIYISCYLLFCPAILKPPTRHTAPTNLGITGTFYEVNLQRLQIVWHAKYWISPSPRHKRLTVAILPSTTKINRCTAPRPQKVQVYSRGPKLHCYP